MDEKTKKIIYLRVSKEEKGKQDIKSQLKAILEKFKLKESECTIFKDRSSAYNIKKEAKRKDFNNMLNFLFQNLKITEVFQDKYEKKKIKFYCWSYDRLSRILEKQSLFVMLCSLHNIKIFSVKEDFLNRSIGDNPTEKIAYYLQVSIICHQAEAESYNTSKRIDKAKVIDNKGVTKSYKGNKWGRKDRCEDKEKKKILELNKSGKSIREICIILTEKHEKDIKKEIKRIKRLKKPKSEIIKLIDEEEKKKPISKTTIHRVIRGIEK